MFTHRYIGEASHKYYGKEDAMVPTWLHQVRCTGYEESIIDCAHTDWGVGNCPDYSRPISLSCIATDTHCRLYACLFSCSDTDSSL